MREREREVREREKRERERERDVESAVINLYINTYGRFEHLVTPA